VNEVKTKTVRVFVGGGHSFFTMHPAYRSAAWQLIRKVHCTCDVEIEDGVGAVVSQCRYHGGGGFYGQRVVSRLVRLWLLRDKAPPGVYRQACKYQENDWGKIPLPDVAKVPARAPVPHKYKFIFQIAALRELARRHPEEFKGLMEATQAEEAICSGVG